MTTMPQSTEVPAVDAIMVTGFDDKSNENLRLSIRNCEAHSFLPPEGVNVYDVLRHDTLVLSKDAAKALEQRILKKGAAK